MSEKIETTNAAPSAAPRQIKVQDVGKSYSAEVYSAANTVARLGQVIRREHSAAVKEGALDALDCTSLGMAAALDLARGARKPVMRRTVGNVSDRYRG